VAQERKLAAALGRRIRALRLEKGWNQVDLEAAVDSVVARSTLGNFESGQRLPSLYTLAFLAKALDVPLAALLLSPEKSTRDRIADEVLRGVAQKPITEARMVAEARAEYVTRPAKKR
jgi:transcriptional regulator with XRE-family HTH domain